jgi:uncharacterized protein YkwD
VRHRHAGPPLPARMAAAVSRVVRTHPSARRRRGGRLVLGTALSTAVTGFVLVVPVVSSGSGEPTPSMALDSSANSASSEASESSAPRAGVGSSPVVMGRDGLPAPSETEAPETALVEPPAATDTTQDAVEVTTEASSPVAATELAESPSTGPSSTGPSSTTSQAAADAPATAPPAAAAAAAPDLGSEVLALVNRARERAGCDPLVADAGLAAVARAHSADMRDRDYFAHDTPEGLSPFDRADQAGVGYARAENIAFGQPDAAAVMEAWMNSAGHRANILDCDLTKLGVGVAEGPGGPWWTQLFGA